MLMIFLHSVYGFQPVFITAPSIREQPFLGMWNIAFGLKLNWALRKVYS
ncbi:hypothetical protein AB205_0140750 [Aquarana catesbeiana]|uniref:Uncharacterized protein n=1 Tax=Aquarana catesbeiana TaxID=8400 RepID=A0A2G9RMM4_AQUCT|nr:hypothetical protein AB205_0140750 [Aquarana catesbeiana]